MMYKADLAVLSLLANYNWDRPIYFASVMGMQANKNLQKQMDKLSNKLQINVITNNQQINGKLTSAA